ncbi:winged helix-turn-helix domain-containing protein [Embleya sp. NBC_00896]|uniref:ArsR/SmtB family transcription factor n=1 Tax=Embleya sp. NBC_00896 TaxID=2975961 RepID=UPI002F91B494|nr:winged helix-turn-helix domain-containing protein [Embleya sp. NBC_00896]
MTASPYTTQAHFFRVLGHPVRVRVLEALGEHPMAARELLSAVGVPSTCLSRQLAILRRLGVVRSALHGSTVVYALRGRDLPALMRAADSVRAALPAGPGVGPDDRARARTHLLANAAPKQPTHRTPPRASRVGPA